MADYSRKSGTRFPEEEGRWVYAALLGVQDDVFRLGCPCPLTQLCCVEGTMISTCRRVAAQILCRRVAHHGKFRSNSPSSSQAARELVHKQSCSGLRRMPARRSCVCPMAISTQRMGGAGRQGDTGFGRGAEIARGEDGSLLRHTKIGSRTPSQPPPWSTRAITLITTHAQRRFFKNKTQASSLSLTLSLLEAVPYARHCTWHFTCVPA